MPLDVNGTGHGAGRVDAAATRLKQAAAMRAEWRLAAALKRFVRALFRRFGFGLVRIRAGFDVVDLYREVDDLRAFRDAAVREIGDLKEAVEVSRDQLSVERSYVAALVSIGECRTPSATISDRRATDDPPYRSCPWIEGGVSFVPGRLRVCPNTHIGGGTPGLVPFKEGLLPVSDIRQRRDIIRRANRAGVFSPCAGCAFSSVGTWAPRAHAFDLVCIAHATACNLACSYCHSIPEARHLQKPGAVPRLYSTFAALIDDGMLAPNSRIQWGGGEPTILREFEALFGLLQRHGAYSEVYTSGVLAPEILLEQVAQGRAGVMISLDAGTAGTYRRIKGRDVFDRVVANAARYAAANPGRTLLKMILSEDNAGEVGAFLDVAEKAGVRIVCFDTPMYRDRIGDRLIDAAARFRQEADRRGLECRRGEVGVVYNLQDQVEARIEEALARADTAPMATAQAKSAPIRSMRSVHSASTPQPKISRARAGSSTV